MNRKQVQSKRERLRAADDELTRTTTLLSVVGEYAEKHERGARTEPDGAKTAFDRYINPAPMDPADRRDHLSHINDAFRDGKDFVTLAKDRITGMSSTSPSGTSESLSTFVDGISKFEGGSSKNEATDPFDALIEHGSPELSVNLVTVISLLATSARAERDEARDDLNNDYPADANDGQRIYDSGAVQQYVDSHQDPIKDLDEHPIALLPVKLETRFVRPPADHQKGKQDVSNPELYDDIYNPQLWVRVYPDTFHVDSHEPELTDDEIRLAKDFWAYCWYATHETLPVDVDSSRHTNELEYLKDRLDDRRAEVLAGLDPAAFPDDPIERKKRIKERIWNQLLDRFGRERSAYIVHEMTPELSNPWTRLSQNSQDVATNPQVLLSLEEPSADATTESGEEQSESDVMGLTKEYEGDDHGIELEKETDSSKQLSSSRQVMVDLTPGIRKVEAIPEIEFPTPERKPETWTRPPKARLLPDQWLVYGVWTPDSSEESTAFLKWTNAIREDLPLGPTPEQLSMARPDVGSATNGQPGSNGDGDEALEWLTDFGEAEKAGMAFRVTESDVFDNGETSKDLTNGTFEKLIVTGVKTSMDADISSDRLRDLFAAHHYTDGLEFLDLGTPTNNFDTESGYSSSEDPTKSMNIETRAVPFVEHGDNTDGDRLARALAIDPDTSDAAHVFGRVENADKTEWLNGWHMRSALWPATASYYLQNMLVPNWLADLESLWGNNETPHMDDVADMLGWHEAYGRHFIDYVTPMGQLSSFRIDRQPYGVLPVTPFADAHEDPFDVGSDGQTRSEDQRGFTTPEEYGRESGESRKFVKQVEKSLREATTDASWLTDDGSRSSETDDDDFRTGGDDDD